eukprot:1774126-Pyramimonas_sp.AAC.1
MDMVFWSTHWKEKSARSTNPGANLDAKTLTADFDDHRTGTHLKQVEHDLTSGWRPSWLSWKKTCKYVRGNEHSK